MKHFLFFITILLILPFAGNTLAQGKILFPPDKAQIEAVMEQYFSALSGGDVATLKSLLGGRLKAKRAPLLKNPEYASYIASAHVNTSFQIQGIHSTTSNTVSVDVIVSFSPEEAVYKSYTLKRNTSSNNAAPYQIVSEAAVAN